MARSGERGIQNALLFFFRKRKVDAQSKEKDGVSHSIPLYRMPPYGMGDGERGIRTPVAVRLWFSRPVHLTALPSLRQSLKKLG